MSRPPFDSLNIGAHVGDDPRACAENRRRVRQALQLPSEPMWLEQVHGSSVVAFDLPVAETPTAAKAPSTGAAKPSPLRADAAIARGAGRVCAIQVADCVPVLFAARDGTAVGAAHAGWRGLAGGVLEATLEALGGGPHRVSPDCLLAWMGPGIGPEHFEVGDEVRAAFMDRDAGAASAFVRNPRGRWQCDLYALARQRLAAAGVSGVYGGAWCTYADPARFYSYRRDGRCGRMAALIWIGSDQAPPAPLPARPNPS